MTFSRSSASIVAGSTSARRPSSFRPAAFALMGALLTHPAAAAAQLEFRGEESTLRLGGQMDMHYLLSSPDDEPDDFLIRRAWITINASYSDFLRADFTYDAVTNLVFDASVGFAFDPAFNLDFGRFKRSFDIFVLNSIADIPFLERAGTVPGVQPTCTGVGSVCTYGRLSERLLFANRDTGIRASGKLGRFGYEASLTNGTVAGVRDANDGKSFATRVRWSPTDGVEVAMNGTLKDFEAPSGDTEYALAWGPDFTIGTWRAGLHVQGAFLTGENWLSYRGPPVPGADPAGPGTFVTAQVQASYFFPLSAERVEGIEPLFRVSLADPDDSIDDDGGLLLTPGVAAYFLGRNRISFNVDWYDPATGDAVWALRAGTLLFY